MQYVKGVGPKFADSLHAIGIYRFDQLAGLSPVDDPSNRDQRFDRTAARKLLAGADWLDPLRLGLAASNCADSEEALDWVAGREFAGRHRRAGARQPRQPRRHRRDAAQAAAGRGLSPCAWK